MTVVSLARFALLRKSVNHGLVAVALAGCAVTTPAVTPQYGDWQGMADQAVAALGKYRGRIMVEVRPNDNAGMYYCQGSRITLGTKGNVRWLFAHEIGHHLDGACEGNSLQSEIAANAGAIKVLQVWGMTEQQAVEQTEAHLLGLQHYRGNHPLPGHNYCAEVAAVVKEYPQYPYYGDAACP